MKRFTIILYVTTLTTTSLAMEHHDWPRPIEKLRAIILGVLTKKPVSEEDIQQTKQLLKEIRVQSPAKAFECEDKLISQRVETSVNSEGFPSCRLLNVTRSPSRGISPLANCSTH